MKEEREIIEEEIDNEENEKKVDEVLKKTAVENREQSNDLRTTERKGACLKGDEGFFDELSMELLFFLPQTNTLLHVEKNVEGIKMT